MEFYKLIEDLILSDDIDNLIMANEFLKKETITDIEQANKLTVQIQELLNPETIKDKRIY